MQQELRRLHHETRSTFIFVTHDQGEAIAMSDRIAVMNAGSVLQVGTPAEIYERPQRRFVAEFMGHSNFVAGRVADIGADRIGHVAATPDVRLTCRMPPDVEIGDEVLVALRYEKVEVLPATAAVTPRRDARDGDLDGALVSETYLGATIRYEVQVAGGLLLLADAGNTGVTRGVAVGDRVRLRWSLDSATVLKD
jgi:spermidine/putrescine transport system ATP-binding protein